jgi:hypothetical protein
VCVNEGGTTFEFLRDGNVEYATKNVVPPLP